MILPAVAYLAYKKITKDKSEQDNDLDWKEKLVKEYEDIRGEIQDTLRLPELTMQLASSDSSPIHATGESSFSSVARKEWIHAVFGKSLQQPKGKGLAQVDEYSCSSIRIPPLEQNQPLGITLQRLTLGLYVRTVEAGSEAEIAGVLPQSVLVKINGICLLAEPSKQALERVLQYEGMFEELTQTAEPANPNLLNGETLQNKSDLIIQEPVHMTFIKNGHLYSILFMACPPFGIEWAPCGNFALVKRNEGSHHNIPKGAIVASVNGNPIDDLDHTTSAKYLKEVMDAGLFLEIKLCWPPPAARSGHWERELLAQQNLSQEKAPARPVPIYSQLHDGVQIRVHSLFTNSSASASIGKASGTISQWATLVSTGEVVKRSKQNQSRLLLSKVYQPCSSLEGRLLENWKLQQAVLFSMKHHWSMNFPDSIVYSYGDIKGLMDNYPKRLVQGILLPLMAGCCSEASEIGFDPVLKLAKSKPSIAPAMELLAMAFNSPQLKNELERMRIEEEATAKTLISLENSQNDDKDQYEPSSASQPQPAMNPPPPDTTAPAAFTPTKTSKSSRFNPFRKKKKASKRQLDVITNYSTSSDQSIQEERPRSTLGSTALGQILEEQDQREQDRQEQRILGCREALFGNTLLYITELALICKDIELSLKRSFPQRIAGWAFLPWSPNTETILQNVTHSMRERLASCQNRQFLNPLASNEMIVDVDPAGSFILPSAHFPLLLTYDCQSIGPGSNFFGKAEALFQTSVEILSVITSGRALSSPTLRRSFQVHASVGGIIKTSSRSTSTSQSDKHVWPEENILTFESRSSWGPPQTLSLRLSEAIVDSEGLDQIMSADSEGTLSYQETVGVCWVDMDPIWGKDGEHIVNAQFWPSHAANQFDEHGELPSELKGVLERLEIQLKITTKTIDSRTTPPTDSDSLSKPSSNSLKRSLLYKHDEDLRQEFFAIEFVKACDTILKSCGLDLAILTFGCIPVGKNQGFIEWVHGSVPLSEICQPVFAGSIFGKKKSVSNLNTSIDSSNISETDTQAEGIPSSIARAGMAQYESLQRITSDLTGVKKNNLDGTDGRSSATAPKNNPIQDYLRSFAYDADSPYMIRKDVMDTYVKSCAGYCAITYILGVGDRHLDNLLLHQTGHFFHCDYSYILGSDPKKYLPLRISQDMVNGMGGKNSDSFIMFLSLTCAAFLTLRRPENVRHLLSLVRIMEGFSLPDVEENQTLEAAILGIRNRMRLDLTENDAISFMEKLIEDSCASKLWIAVDAIHTLGKRF